MTRSIGQPPALVQHAGAEDIVWVGCPLPLDVPEADDPRERVNPLQDPAHGARVLAPRGVPSLVARLDQRQHVHEAAELDVLELVDQGLGHADRRRRQGCRDGAEGGRGRRAVQVGPRHERDDDGHAVRDRPGRPLMVAAKQFPGGLDQPPPVA